VNEIYEERERDAMRQIKIEVKVEEEKLAMTNRQ
jgi:hypothetical protein